MVMQSWCVRTTPFGGQTGVTWVNVSGVFPSLWETSIVEGEVPTIELAQFAFLRILLDGVVSLVSCNFVLFAGPLRDLADEVVEVIAIRGPE